MTNVTVAYFGLDTVQKAILQYYATYGCTEQVRDTLMQMESENGDAFFEMVAQYIEGKQKVNYGN